MLRTSRAVRIVSGTVLASVLALPAAAEEKSTKPRIAVIEFKNKADSQLQVDSVRFGEWIADVERPQAIGSWAKAEGLDVTWDAAGSAGSARANDRLRTAGPRDGWPSEQAGEAEITLKGSAAPGASQPLTVGGNRTESKLPGKRTPPTVTLKRGMTSSSEAGVPRQRGSVMLRLAQPWAGCTVGDRFDGAYVTVGVGHRYRLGEGEVARCDGSSVTINYTRFAADGTPVR